jgi:hypothetical protein
MGSGTRRILMSRDACAAAHDWVGYWSDYVQGATARLHRFRELKAPASMIQEQEDQLSRWTRKLEDAKAGVWVASKRELPTGYRYRPGCSCCLCQGVEN